MRPCSADSSRKAGPSNAARSFRKAETGVSQSSMKRNRTGTTFAATASSRARSSGGSSEGGRSAATAIERLECRAQRHPAGGEQHLQVVQDVRGLLREALAGLVRGRAGGLVG